MMGKYLSKICSVNFQASVTLWTAHLDIIWLLLNSNTHGTTECSIYWVACEKWYVSPYMFHTNLLLSFLKRIALIIWWSVVMWSYQWCSTWLPFTITLRANHFKTVRRSNLRKACMYHVLMRNPLCNCLCFRGKPRGSESICDPWPWTRRGARDFIPGCQGDWQRNIRRRVPGQALWDWTDGSH